MITASFAEKENGITSSNRSYQWEKSFAFAFDANEIPTARVSNNGFVNDTFFDR